MTARRSSPRARLRSRAAAQVAGPYPDPDFRQLDSWIVIHQDTTATFYVGKTDCGQGTGTAFRQMMSDELDIAFDKTTCIMGSTDITVDQGGSGASDAPRMRCSQVCENALADHGRGWRNDRHVRQFERHGERRAAFGFSRKRWWQRDHHGTIRAHVKGL